eukprot:2401954-Rhodomonas_salina.1
MFTAAADASAVFFGLRAVVEDSSIASVQMMLQFESDGTTPVNSSNFTIRVVNRVVLAHQPANGFIYAPVLNAGGGAMQVVLEDVIGRQVNISRREITVVAQDVGFETEGVDVCRCGSELCTTASSVGGRATFPDLWSLTQAQSRVLKFDATLLEVPLETTSQPFQVSGLQPWTLEADSMDPISTQPFEMFRVVITVLDEYLRPARPSTVVVQLLSSDGTLDQTFRRTSNLRTGIADFNDLRTAITGDRTIRVTVAGATNSVEIDLHVTPAPLYTLRALTQNVRGMAGEAVQPVMQLRFEDQFQNTIRDPSMVQVSILDGGADLVGGSWNETAFGPLITATSSDAMCTSTACRWSSADGIATLSGLVLRGAGDYTLRAHALDAQGNTAFVFADFSVRVAPYLALVVRDGMEIASSAAGEFLSGGL